MNASAKSRTSVRTATPRCPRAWARPAPRIAKSCACWNGVGNTWRSKVDVARFTVFALRSMMARTPSEPSTLVFVTTPSGAGAMRWPT